MTPQSITKVGNEIGWRIYDIASQLIYDAEKHLNEFSTEMCKFHTLNEKSFSLTHEGITYNVVVDIEAQGSWYESSIYVLNIDRIEITACQGNEVISISDDDFRGILDKVLYECENHIYTTNIANYTL